MADFKEIQVDGQVYQVKDETARNSQGGYEPPTGGIPKTDLASDVQTSLGKADTSLQPSDKTQLQSAINSLQNALNTLIGSGNVQGAIDTFNEVKAFLNGIDTDDPTLANQLLALNNTIRELQNTLSSKANSSDLVNYATKSELGGKLSQSDVSVETQGDGTVDINVADDTYTINLNHTHEGMAKLVKCTEATLPQTLEDDTIYVQVDNLTTPTEIEALHIFGLEFTGGGGAAPGVPYLSSPGANISMGDSENGSVTKAIRVKGRFLTQALSATLNGTGYTFGTTQPTGVTRNSDTSLTITADAAKAGVDISVIYTGTAFNATGTLDIISSSPDSIDNESTLVANPATIENLAAVKLNGTQWMQTDYYPQANTRFELDCKFIKNGYSSTGTGTNQGKFLGCDNGASKFYFNNGAYYPMANSTNKVFSIYAWAEHGYVEGGQIYSHEYGTEQVFCQRGVMSYSNGSISFLGSTWTTETRVSTSEHPLCIGYFNGEIYGNFDLEIYELKIYNGTTLVYDFKPVSKDGVYGLLDAASGTFISSQTNSPLIPIFLT